MTGYLYVAHIGLWVAIVVEGLAICALLYKNNRLLEIAGDGFRDHAVGMPAPNFLATDLRTGAVVSNDQFVGSRTFLLFVTPACPTCHRLMEELNDMYRVGVAQAGTLLAYCDGSSQGCVDAFSHSLRSLNGIPLLAESDAELVDLFGVRALPALVEMDRAWRIAGYSYPSTWENLAGIISTNGREEENP